MFKKIAILLVICFALSLIGTHAALAADTKIGVINMKKAFYDYNKTKELEKDLEKVTKALGQDRKKMVDELTKLRGELDLLSGNAKNKKKIEIDKKLAQLAEFDRESRRQLMAKRNDMFKEVVDEIVAVIENIGKKQNYDYILDEQSVRYFKENYDITDEVLKRLNKK